MYTWILDYVYNGLITLMFILTPLLTYYINGKAIVSNKKLKNFLLSLMIFLIFSVLIFLIKDFHIKTIEKICFDYPVLVYKNNIPQGCYDFDISKYQGVGWTLKIAIWGVLDFFYLLFVYGLIILYRKYKERR